MLPPPVTVMAPPLLVLKKNTLKPHRRQCWVIPPKANSAFVAAMEDVLAVYTRPRDPDARPAERGERKDRGAGEQRMIARWFASTRPQSNSPPRRACRSR